MGHLYLSSDTTRDSRSSECSATPTATPYPPPLLSECHQKGGAHTLRARVATPRMHGTLSQLKALGGDT